VKKRKPLTEEQRARKNAWTRNYRKTHPRKPATPEQKQKRRLYHREWEAKRKDNPRAIELRRANQRRYYEKRKQSPDYKKKQKIRARAAYLRASKECRRIRAAYLIDNPCVDCGEPDIRLLEFDHVRGKKLFNVSKYKSNPKELILEIAKCEVRCKSCHRKKTRESTRNIMQPAADPQGSLF
jgi:hypothetical protein